MTDTILLRRFVFVAAVIAAIAGLSAAALAQRQPDSKRRAPYSVGECWGGLSCPASALRR